MDGVGRREMVVAGCRGGEFEEGDAQAGEAEVEREIPRRRRRDARHVPRQILDRPPEVARARLQRRDDAARRRRRRMRRRGRKRSRRKRRKRRRRRREWRGGKK